MLTMYMSFVSFLSSLVTFLIALDILVKLLCIYVYLPLWLTFLKGLLRCIERKQWKQHPLSSFVAEWVLELEKDKWACMWNAYPAT